MTESAAFLIAGISRSGPTVAPDLSFPGGFLTFLEWERRPGGPAVHPTMRVHRPVVVIEGSTEPAEARDVAQHVADCLGGLISLVLPPLGFTFSVHEVEQDWLTRGALYGEEMMGNFHWLSERIGAFSVEPAEEFDEALSLLPGLIARKRDRGAFPALVFWQASTKNYLVMAGEIDELLRNPGLAPETAVERAVAEDGLQNTWKAIEALTGQWKFKSEGDLDHALVRANVDTEIGIRWSDGSNETLGRRLWNLKRDRDNRAAHGSPPSSPQVPRGTTFLDLSRAQMLAAIAIQSVLGAELPPE